MDRLYESDRNCDGNCKNCVAICGMTQNTIFLEAADVIEELLAAVPKWVSVEDELPEENKQIISYLAYKGMAVLQYENKHFYMQGAFQPLPKEAVTHWMPLPKAPAPPKGVE